MSYYHKECLDFLNIKSINLFLKNMFTNVVLLQKDKELFATNLNSKTFSLD